MSVAVALSFEARQAAIGGTRHMIHEDEFSALVALLVDCGAVPRNVMAGTLRRLAEMHSAKARLEQSCGYLIHSGELFARAQLLREYSSRLSA